MLQVWVLLRAAVALTAFVVVAAGKPGCGLRRGESAPFVRASEKLQAWCCCEEKLDLLSVQVKAHCLFGGRGKEAAQ